MKNLLFLSICLLVSGTFAMHKHRYTLQEPYFDSRKQEYVIEAADQQQARVAFVSYYPTTGNTWLMHALEVDHEHRRKGIAVDLMAECIKKVKEANGMQLEWQIWPKDIGMTENRLIAIYYEMLEKINPGYASKTSQEYRGHEDFQSSWLILNLD